MPVTEPEPDAEPEPEITLEEWIESTQSCCGVEPESRPKRKPAEPPGEPDGPGVQSGDAPSQP